jgi:micrococcal nuclease
VIDGDTITVNGRTIRLVGFIAPETRDAQCKAERNLGDKAANRLRELVLAGGLEYSPVMCPCPATILGNLFCNFVRSCGTLKAYGRNVGDILVEEGLAATYSCRNGGSPRARRLWCDTVEKVCGMPSTRNNRINIADFLNRSCAFDARFESILL